MAGIGRVCNWDGHHAGNQTDRAQRKAFHGTSYAFCGTYRRRGAELFVSVGSHDCGIFNGYNVGHQLPKMVRHCACLCLGGSSWLFANAAGRTLSERCFGGGRYGCGECVAFVQNSAEMAEQNEAKTGRLKRYLHFSIVSSYLCSRFRRAEFFTKWGALTRRAEIIPLTPEPGNAGGGN